VALGLIWLPAALIIAGLVACRVTDVRPLAIRTGSMTPTLSVGSLVLTHSQRADTFRPGDIVTFHDTALGGGLVTHRIRAIHQDGGKLAIETRGDANKVSEFWTANPDAMLGRTIWHAPTLGRVLVEPKRYFGVVAVLIVSLLVGGSVIRRILTVPVPERPVPERAVPEQESSAAPPAPARSGGKHRRSDALVS
jgi:signal peptidase